MKCSDPETLSKEKDKTWALARDTGEALVGQVLLAEIDVFYS